MSSRHLGLGNTKGLPDAAIQLTQENGLLVVTLAKCKRWSLVLLPRVWPGLPESRRSDVATDYSHNHED